VPVGVSAGAHQDHVEDFLVCCHSITLHVDIASDGESMSVDVFFGSFGVADAPNSRWKAFHTGVFLAGAGRGWANLLC
jgi:hypothetical protein